MANITTTEVSAVIPTIVAAQTLGALSSNLVLANIVNRDYDEEIARYGQTVDIGRRGAVVANDKTANSNVTRQTPSATATQVTLNKHKEVTIAEEDLAIMFARPDMITGYAQDAAIVLAEAIEGDIAALHSGFSTTPINATTGLGDDDFREAGRLLNAAKAPQSNRWAVLHEDAYKEAQAIEKLINRDYQGDAAMEAIKQGFLGWLGGFNVVLSQNIKVATSECKNLFLHRDAIVLATRPMRLTDKPGVMQVIQVENGIALRVTMSYDANMLADQMTIDVLYGVAELRDAFGLVVRSAEVA